MFGAADLEMAHRESTGRAKEEQEMENRGRLGDPSPHSN